MGDWSLIGPIGEDGPAQGQGWDRVNEYAVAALSGRSTPLVQDKTLAELLCQGPPGLARRRRQDLKKRGFNVRPCAGPSVTTAAGTAAGPPSAQGAPSAASTPAEIC